MKGLRLKLYITVLLFTGLLIATPLQAETLVELYDLALQLDPRFREQKASAMATGEQAEQATASLLPTLTLTADGQRVHSEADGAQIGVQLGENGFPEPVLGLARDHYRAYGYGVELSQPVFDLARWHLFQQGRLVGQRQQWELRQARQELMLRVAERYLAVLNAEATLAIAQQARTELTRQLEQTERLLEAGLASRTDVLETQAAKYRTEVDRIHAEHDVHEARENLRVLSRGRLVHTLPINVLPAVLTQASDRDADAWTQIALRENVELGLARLELQIQQRELEARRAEYWPRLNLVASTRHEETANGQTDLSSETTTFGLSLEMNLFQGGATNSRIREMAHRVESLRERFTARSQDIQNQVLVLWRALRANALALDALEQSLEFQESALQAAEKGYLAGERDILDILRVRTDLFRTRADRAEVIYDQMLDWLALLQTTGVIERKDLEALSGFTGTLH